MTAETVSAPPPIWTRSTKGTITAVAILAVVYGAVALVFGVAHVVDTIGAPATPVTLPASADVPTGPLGSGASATITSGAFTSAEVTIGGLSTGARLLLASGAGIDVLTQLGVVTAVVMLCWRMLKERPFTRTITTTATIVACTIAIGGMLSQALSGFGGWSAVQELGWSGPDDPFLFGLVFTPAPVLAGFALAVVAQAFQLAERLQHDTDGLV